MKYLNILLSLSLEVNENIFYQFYWFKMMPKTNENLG